MRLAAARVHYFAQLSERMELFLLRGYQEK